MKTSRASRSPPRSVPSKNRLWTNSNTESCADGHGEPRIGQLDVDRPRVAGTRAPRDVAAALEGVDEPGDAAHAQPHCVSELCRRSIRRSARASRPRIPSPLTPSPRAAREPPPRRGGGARSARGTLPTRQRARASRRGRRSCPSCKPARAVIAAITSLPPRPAALSQLPSRTSLAPILTAALGRVQSCSLPYAPSPGSPGLASRYGTPRRPRLHAALDRRRAGRVARPRDDRGGGRRGDHDVRHRARVRPRSGGARPQRAPRRGRPPRRGRGVDGPSRDERRHEPTGRRLGRRRPGEGDPCGLRGEPSRRSTASLSTSTSSTRRIRGRRGRPPCGRWRAWSTTASCATSASRT